MDGEEAGSELSSLRVEDEEGDQTESEVIQNLLAVLLSDEELSDQQVKPFLSGVRFRNVITCHLDLTAGGGAAEHADRSQGKIC